MIPFSKYHALGNDYLVLEPRDCPQFFTPEAIRAVCHRNFGLGSDGILYGPLASTRADFRLQIWNPDGSEAEKSGNGLRIFARYLFDTQRVTHKPFTIETLGGVVRCQVHREDLIQVEMGKISFDAAVIPVLKESGEVINRTLDVNGERLTYCAASIGNPHAVFPVETLSRQRICEIGPVVERMTSVFPNRTNVQLLKVLDRNTIAIEIWERGAGYTLASGSSSSATAAVARKLGLCDSEIQVHCPGGVIGIIVADDFGITMSGPATRVGRFEMDLRVPHQKGIAE